MATAAISKLKARLSEYIGRVKQGEEVLVTEHGKPVARLVPVEKIPEDARRADLVRRGIIKPGKTGRIGDELLNRLPVVDLPPDALQRVMDEEREDRV